MSDTPRTDAKRLPINSHTLPGDVVYADFARELERENAVLREALGNIHKHAHCISKAGPRWIGATYFP